MVSVIIADVVTALPWDFNAKLDWNAVLDGKAREKRAKYFKYDIPFHSHPRQQDWMPVQ